MSRGTDGAGKKKERLTGMKGETRTLSSPLKRSTRPYDSIHPGSGPSPSVCAPASKTTPICPVSMFARGGPGRSAYAARGARRPSARASAYAPRAARAVSASAPGVGDAREDMGEEAKGMEGRCTARGRNSDPPRWSSDDGRFHMACIAGGDS
jgi:hypothetical protein